MTAVLCSNPMIMTRALSRSLKDGGTNACHGCRLSIITNGSVASAATKNRQPTRTAGENPSCRRTLPTTTPDPLRKADATSVRKKPASLAPVPAYVRHSRFRRRT
jgi:hypothetical protein